MYGEALEHGCFRLTWRDLYSSYVCFLQVQNISRLSQKSIRNPEESVWWDQLQGAEKKILFKWQSLKYFNFIVYLCSFSAMLCAILQNRSVPGLDFAVPWAGCRSVCHSRDLFLWTFLCGTQVLQLLGAFPFSPIPELVMAALPAGLNHFYFSHLCILPLGNRPSRRNRCEFWVMRSC